jgi:hypothetical protein
LPFFYILNNKIMPKQKGFLKLIGALGDTMFTKTKDGYKAKEKAEFPADRFANHHNYQRTRENCSEFSRAGKAGKLFRQAFQSIIQAARSSRIAGRMLGAFMAVVKADMTSIRGERNVMDGETELMKGFEFNLSSPLGTTFHAPFTSSIDRATGQLSVTIPPFVPARAVTSPVGSTHVRLISGGGAIDFEAGTFDSNTEESASLPLNNLPTAGITLTHSLPAASTRPLFLLLGVVFYQQVNGIDYQLSDSGSNALCVVDVNGE